MFAGAASSAGGHGFGGAVRANLVILLLWVLPAQAGLGFFPVAAYAPETGAILGAWLQRVDGTDSLCRPDQAALWLIFSTRGQAEAGLRPEAWWAADRWTASGELSYQHWPAGWHGVGPDSPETPVEFTVERAKLEARLRRRLAVGVYGGLWLLGTRESVTEHDAGVPAAAMAGRDAGVGLELAVDSRDGTVWPCSGWLAVARAARHRPALGGDWAYARWLVDLRRYRPLGAGVLAVQAAVEGRAGEPGPRALPRLSSWLRALDDLRYLDRWAGAARLEWRRDLPFTLPTARGRRLAERLGLVFFTEAGQVGSRGADLLAGPWKSSLGLGGRFALLPRERLNVRADLAFGAEGAALRIKLGEAF